MPPLYVTRRGASYHAGECLAINQPSGNVPKGLKVLQPCRQCEFYLYRKLLRMRDDADPNNDYRFDMRIAGTVSEQRACGFGFPGRSDPPEHVPRVPVWA